METAAAITALVAYRDQQRPVGHFLTGVLENNLAKVIQHADETSWQNLKAIFAWVWMEMPSHAWGTVDAVTQWQGQPASARTLDEWRLAVETPKCLSCGSYQGDDDLEHYEMQFGWPVRGFKERQWLFFQCPCGHQTSINKLGVERPD
jgi:hypothetical protein